MMKGYVTPKLRIIDISTTCLLAQSTPDGNGFGSPDLPSAVRGRRTWDDDEEEW